MVASMIMSLCALVGAASVETVSLKTLEKRFKNGGDTVYVVNFWATWCKPCVQELPAFDKFHRSIGKRKVKVILVSLDDPADIKTKVERFINKAGYRPEVVLLDESKPHEWIDMVDESWSGAIPATWFIDAASNRRLFFEQDFTYDELVESVNTFAKVSP